MKWVLIGLLFLLCFGIWLVLSSKPSKHVSNVRQADAKERGRDGERRVRAAIGETKEGLKYVINDYILDTDTEVGTTQIDHIVINAYGIFVIETKNYSGKITGTEEDSIWKQTFSNSRRQYNISNPIIQNEYHVRHLSKILPYNARIYSVVVFVKNNVYVQSDKVYNLKDINKALMQGKPRYQWKQINKFGKILEENRSFATTSEHINNIKRVEDEYEEYDF